ncbi:MAG: hypothetical protein U5O39_19950 [Gammaproteobacteria bacterium]|nr:hypothetical protein [Gammaproteobacteria bacterium]
MTDNETFDEKLARWTITELKYELTKRNIYGEKKLRRLEQELARRELAAAGQKPDPDLVKSDSVNWNRLGVIVAVIFGFVGFIVTLYWSGV